jgi:DNA-binding GntR family transcriptional regulator
MQSAGLASQTARLEFHTREQLVYEYLRQAISQGRWGPDEPIVGQRVALELGVSRITVANALKRLAGEGFVRLSPHREAVVAPINPAEIEDIYITRAALEAEAAFVACAHVDDQVLAELQQLNAAIGSARKTGEVAVTRAADRAFHARLNNATGLPGLVGLIVNLVDRCEYYRARLLDVPQLVVPQPARHEPLLSALVEHDCARARDLARDHVLHGMRSILGALDKGKTASSG